jgi:hypothetical protein
MPLHAVPCDSNLLGSEFALVHCEQAPWFALLHFVVCMPSLEVGVVPREAKAMFNDDSATPKHRANRSVEVQASSGTVRPPRCRMQPKDTTTPRLQGDYMQESGAATRNTMQVSQRRPTSIQT